MFKVDGLVLVLDSAEADEPTCGCFLDIFLHCRSVSHRSTAEDINNYCINRLPGPIQRFRSTDQIVEHNGLHPSTLR